MRKKIQERTLKRLFALSGNVCAFPECNEILFDDDGNLIGEMCHIEAANPGGERYNQNQTDDERASFNNLIVFCANHHKVTNNISIYTVEKLKEMKKDHESHFTNSPYKINKSELKSVLTIERNKEHNSKNIHYKYSPHDKKEIIKYQPFLIIKGYDVDFESNDSKTISEIKRFQHDNNLYDDGIIKTQTIKVINCLIEESKYLPVLLNSVFNANYKTPFERDTRQGFIRWFEKSRIIHNNIPFIVSDKLISYTDGSKKITIQEYDKLEAIHILYTAAWVYDNAGENIEVIYIYTNGNYLKDKYVVNDWTWHKTSEGKVEDFTANCDNELTNANIYILTLKPPESADTLNAIEIITDNAYLGIIAVTIQKQ